MKKLMILAKSLVNSAGMEKMTVEFANAMICNGYAVEILLQDSNIESFYKLDSSINISSLHSYSLYSIYSIKKIRKIVLESKVDYLINIDKELNKTYEVYQSLLYSLKHNEYHLLETTLSEQHNNISEYMKTSIKTLKIYLLHIKNTLSNPYHNGFVEGNNNFIKVLKRIAFGFRSFRRFNFTFNQ